MCNKEAPHGRLSSRPLESLTVVVEAGSSAVHRPFQAAAHSILNSKAFFFFLKLPLKTWGMLFEKNYSGISKHL